jgi:dTDP-4-amino-4,6-dideoxygalactose transaminase
MNDVPEPRAKSDTAPIPLLDLKAQLATYREAALAAMTRVVDAQEMIMGPEVGQFERALAAYAGVRSAIGMSSGTDALLAALMALDVGPGDEVVTSTFSFFATAGVVARLGAKPVFTDIDPSTFNATEAGLRAAITARTKAIIPVHLFGQMADIRALAAATDRPPIIEDSAQSLGARLDGRMTGAFGAMTCVSFFPSKNLGGFGDGGATLTDDPALAEKLAILRVHGSKPKYFHHVVGGNFRLDTLQAAVLAVKLPLLDTWAEGRRRNAATYDALFAQAGLVERGLVTPPAVLPGAFHVYNQYVVRVPRRDALAAFLTARGIGTAVYYPRPLHLQPCFADLGHGPGDFPNAEQACAEVLALPVYPELPEGAQARVVQAIAEFFGA